VENAGQSKIYGFEASIDALLGESDKVDLGLTLLHARFDSFLAAPGLSAATADCRNTINTDAGINCQLAGNMLPQAPNATVSAGYEHTFRLPAAALLKFRLEGRYQTKQYFDPFNFADTEQAGYGLINAYLNYSRDQWQIGIFGRNLGDKLYLVDAEEYTPPGAHAYRYGFGAPRTFGIHIEAAL
jgi:iron complex outermembrane receptor protein